MLSGQENVELEVSAVAHAIGEVGDDRALDRPGVAFDALAHVFTL